MLGHSFGGYLATSYAIEHPERFVCSPVVFILMAKSYFSRVKHLILADPWGFSDVPPDFKLSIKLRVLKVLFFPLFYMNPLATVRVAGPLGKFSLSVWMLVNIFVFFLPCTDIILFFMFWKIQYFGTSDKLDLLAYFYYSKQLVWL